MNPLNVETKFVTLGFEATHIWRNHDEPRHAVVVASYVDQARTLAKVHKCRVCLQGSDGRALYTTPRHREKRS